MAASSAMEIGSTYSSIESYLEALERRQTMEKAPTAACFMVGGYDMLMLEIAGHPWLTRVRCELPTRPLGPSGEEEPVKATYIGSNDKEDPEQYKKMQAAMALIDVTRTVHLKCLKPTPKALAHLEQSDIVVIGDGPHVHESWLNMQEGSCCALIDRIKWRFYSGAVLIGVGTGAMLMGSKWFVGHPQQELDAREKGYQQRTEEQRVAERDSWGGVDYFASKAMELCPAFFSTSFEKNEALARLQGAVAAAITLPPLGAAIFNIDGTLEPSNAILYEHVWDWKKEVLKTCVLHPPDEKTNILRCAEYVEKKKAKLRAKRIAMGLGPDAPVDLEDDEDEDEDEGEEEMDEEAEEILRKLERDKFIRRSDVMDDLNKRKKEEAQADREQGAFHFKQGNHEQALKYFETSAEKDPLEFKTQLNRTATLLKLDMPRRAVVAADKALHLTNGKEAKAWYRRATAWLACGEFNEAIADCDAAKRLEPTDKAIAMLRKKCEEERENATWGFAADSRKVEKLKEQLENPKLSEADKMMLKASEGVGTKGGLINSGDWTEGSSHLDACRTMLEIEDFNGQRIELGDGLLKLTWEPTRDEPEEETEVITPAMLDQRALFCIEEVTKRSRLNTLSIKGGCLGAWGTAFVARGARIEGAGLETLALVDCRLRAEGAASIASLLSRGSKLVDLDLSGNGIGDDGMNDIAKELGKNEYLERLKLSRNRITNKRMGALGATLGGHPVLRTLDLSHNLISYQGVTHLANGVRESVSLTHLSIAHNKSKADALYRLASVCSGHETMATLDCRGTPLRKGDRRKLEAHTRFTRLQIFIDPAPESEIPVAAASQQVVDHPPSKEVDDDDDDNEISLEDNVQETGEDDEPRIEEVDDEGVPAEPEPVPAKAKLTTIKSGMPGSVHHIDESTSEPTRGRDEDDALPASLIQRTDVIKEEVKEPEPDPDPIKPNSSRPAREWVLPAGDISTRQWVTGFGELGLW